MGYAWYIPRAPLVVPLVYCLCTLNVSHVHLVWCTLAVLYYGMYTLGMLHYSTPSVAFVHPYCTIYNALKRNKEAMTESSPAERVEGI